MLSSILDLCHELIPADGYAIWRQSAPLGPWSIVMKSGISDWYAEAAVARVNELAGNPASPQNPEGRLILQKTLRVEDVTKAGWSGTTDLYATEGIRSMMVVPLEIGTLPLGTLVVYFRSPHRFREVDDHLALVLATLASKAVSSAQIYREGVSFWQRELAESHRAGFLAEVAAVFASSLDYRKNLEAMASLCVPYLADWCVIDTVSTDGDLELTAIAHLNPALVEQARALRREFPPNLDGADFYAMNYRSGQPQLIRTIRPEMIDALPDSELKTFIASLSLKSVLMVPIRVRDRTVGVLTCLQSDSGRTFQKSDLYLAEELARRAAVTIDRSLLFQQAKETVEARDVLLHKLQKQIKQQAALTAISRNGLSQAGLASLFDDAVFWLTHALDIERCCILETADGSFQVKGSSGWEPGQLPALLADESSRQLLLEIPPSSPLLYERPQSGPERAGLLADASAVLAQIRPRETAYGVIGVFSRQSGAFSQDDIQFLQSTANIIAAAVDRLRAEQALAESEQKYRQLFNLSPSGILLADAAYHVTRANPAANRIFGSESEALLMGADLRSLLFPRDGKSGRENGVTSVHDVEVMLNRLDGRAFPAEVSLETLSDPTGEGVFGIVRDITQRKELEGMKADFIATVSHELRTPLTSVLVSLELLAGGRVAPGSPQAISLIEVAHKNCQRLTRLINDFLDFQKAEAGRVELELHETDLVPLIDQAVQMNQMYAQQYGVRFVGDIRCGEARAVVDADRFMQILTNLLSNAAKFSTSGTEVTIGAVCSDSDVRVSVTNRGPTIPEEYRGKLFGKFVQVGSSLERKRQGSGLGLAISKSLVETMGGRIDFRSSDGETEFFFELPRVGDRAGAPR
jgi:PAS domain S-box-containing protein